MPELKVVGKPVLKHDAISKVCGKLIYAEDYSLPNMLHGKVLRSKYPAARIISIDTSKAENLPGVKAVLTAKDVPNNNTLTKFGQTRDVGGGFEALYRVLAENKVRFMGEAVALVAADTKELAEDAMNLIEVNYEPQPGVFDPLEALKPDAYLVGEEKSNLISRFQIKKGDIEVGFSEADLVIENTYRVPFVDHAYLEPESGVAWLDENSVITIRVCTQVVEHFRGIAKALNIPQNRVRVIGTMNGGGFGGKEDITVETFLALLVMKTGRPVKMTYTREESFIAHSKRHPYVMEYKVGAKNDGRVVALKARLVSDGGAYPYLSPWVLLYSTVNAAGPYNIANVYVETMSALTNNTFSSANRGFGAIQPNFAYESIMNELADKLGIDPLEIRKINCVKQGDELAVGMKMERFVAIPDAAERAWEALGPVSATVAGSKKVGRGLAMGMMSYGRMTFLHDTSRSYVRLELDGSVTVRCGVPDVGGGQASSLCQIVAEELGVPMSRLNIYISDTALTPLAGTTTATRQLYMSGNATLKAAREIRRRLLERAAPEFDVAAVDLDIADEKVYLISDPARFKPLVEIVGLCSSEGVELFCEAQFNAPFTDIPDLENLKGRIFPDFTFGAHAVEVIVDEETGTVDVSKIVSCFDVGQCINPLGVEGQLEGGAVYCQGYALTEEMILDQGITLNPSFAGYLIPTAMDSPEVKTIILESGSGLGPYGSKGIGEPSCNSVAPAITNAIYDAVGVRIRSLPASPEKIWTALKSKA